MTTWHEYVQQTGRVPAWPYPTRYDEMIEIDTDVLVIGGGIADCHAAINAVRQGASSKFAAELWHNSMRFCRARSVSRAFAVALQPAARRQRALLAALRQTCASA